MARVFIALGGNLGDVRATFGRAIDMLCAGGAVKLIGRSADYRTPPWGVTDQPPFVNACIAVETDLPPQALLERTQGIEKALGRDRRNDTRWGPRPIDLDLIAYDDLTVDTPDLKLPHPYLFERAFVLVPLAEIAPEAVIGGRGVAEALAGIDRGGITRLPAQM